jgi:predicted aldo/keto reductase-like oxidoreductase
MNKLSFGLMRMPVRDKNDASSVDTELVKKMVDAFIDAGFT